jgi:hypothetical protein
MIRDAAFAECHGLDLMKHFPITEDEIEDAQDGDVINHHLILQKEYYFELDLYSKNDILFVHARKLRKVSQGMFRFFTNVQKVDFPLVETIEEEDFIVVIL